MYFVYWYRKILYTVCTLCIGIERYCIQCVLCVLYTLCIGIKRYCRQCVLCVCIGTEIYCDSVLVLKDTVDSVYFVYCVLCVLV